jgi:hypothetical protein
MATENEERVENRLSQGILPPLLAVKRNAGRSLIRLYTFHFLAGEVTGFLFAAGVGGPLFGFMGSATGADKLKGAGIATIIVAAAWYALKVYLMKTDAGSLTAVRETCRKTFGEFEQEMYRILRGEDDPLPALRELVRKMDAAEKYHARGFPVPPNTKSVMDESLKMAKDLMQTYKGNWTKAIAEQRALPPAEV